MLDEWTGKPLVLVNGEPYQRPARGVRRISPSTRRKVVARDHSRCRYCGRPVAENINSGFLLTIDHIIPVVRGGTKKPSNLVVCCRTCNNRKGDRTLDEAGMVLLEPGADRPPQDMRIGMVAEHERQIRALRKQLKWARYKIRLLQRAFEEQGRAYTALAEDRDDLLAQLDQIHAS